jgi:hypothetical protein
MLHTTGNTLDDLKRHREWLDRELRRYGRPNVPSFEYGAPTYVIRVSWDSMMPLRRAVVDALGTLGQGADIQEGVGIWGGQAEPSVTIEIQATDDVLADVLDRLATIEKLQWVHIEKHTVPTAYVNLDERR